MAEDKPNGKQIVKDKIKEKVLFYNDSAPIKLNQLLLELEVIGYVISLKSLVELMKDLVLEEVLMFDQAKQQFFKR